MSGVHSSDMYTVYVYIMDESRHACATSYCILETTQANHNWDRCRSPIRCRCLTRGFDPNPGVVISDNYYKTRQGSLHVLQGAPWYLAHPIPGDCGEQGCRPPALSLQPSRLPTKSRKVIWHFMTFSIFSPFPFFLSLNLLIICTSHCY